MNVFTIIVIAICLGLGIAGIALYLFNKQIKDTKRPYKVGDEVRAQIPSGTVFTVKEDLGDKLLLEAEVPKIVITRLHK